MPGLCGLLSCAVYCLFVVWLLASAIPVWGSGSMSSGPWDRGLPMARPTGYAEMLSAGYWPASVRTWSEFVMVGSSQEA